MNESKYYSINDFAEEVKEEISKRYGVDVSVQEVTKNNNVKYTSILVRESDSNISPTIYLDEYYRKYRDVGFERIVDMKKIEIAYQEHLNQYGINYYENRWKERLQG